MKNTFIAVGVVAIILLTGLSLPAPAFASHSWSTYHWARTSNPFTLKLGDNVTSLWDAYLAEASIDWSASNVLDTQVVAGLTSARTCKAVTGRVEVCNAKYGNNGWLGLASISINSTGHITKGTAKMNDTYFNTPTYNTPAWKRLVMCQEVAHDFGLDHQDEVFDNANLGTCMDYTNDPDGGAGGAVGNDPSNEHPNAHDFDQLEIIYGHLDSSTTIGNSLPSTKGVIVSEEVKEVEKDGDWGRAIRTDASGRPNVFEKDLGKGEKKITHVFWLPL